MRGCQGAAGSYQLRRVVLLPCQGVNFVGKPHRCSQFAGYEGVAPLTYQCHIQLAGDD